MTNLHCFLRTQNKEYNTHNDLASNSVPLCNRHWWVWIPNDIHICSMSIYLCQFIVSHAEKVSLIDGSDERCLHARERKKDRENE